MEGLKYRLLAALASTCLFVSIFTAPRPDGLLDHTVWPVAYSASAAASLLIAIRPRRFFLHVWASLIITIQLFRTVLFGINPTLPSLRWASVAANLFFAILAYFVWAGWKDRFVIEPLLAKSEPSAKETELADLEAIIADETEARSLRRQQSPPQQEERYRLPTVPGLPQ